MRVESTSAINYQHVPQTSDATDTMTISDFKELLLAKIKNGNAAPKFQIGNQAYTVKEWDKFIGRFDSSEDTVRKAIEEEAEKAAAKAFRAAESK